MGCSMAMVLSSLGAAYGIAKSGIGISAVSVLRPDMMVRSTTPSLSFLVTNQNYILILSPPRSDATHPRRHPRNLRPCRLGHDYLLSQREIRPPHKFHAARCWAICRTMLSQCRVLYWDCGGCWGQRDCTAAKAVCRDDVDVDLC